MSVILVGLSWGRRRLWWVALRGIIRPSININLPLWRWSWWWRGYRICPWVIGLLGRVVLLVLPRLILTRVVLHVCL